MKILHRFFELPIRDQRLLLYSLVLLAFFKFAIRWFSFKTLLYFSTKASSANTGSHKNSLSNDEYATQEIRGINLSVLAFTKERLGVISKAISVFWQVPTFKAIRHQCREKESADRVIWAVLAVARRIPILDNCLTKALTTKVLLNTEGCPTVLRIGVTKGDFGQLKAHAWLESESGLLIGSAECDRYAALPLFDGESM